MANLTPDSVRGVTSPSRPPGAHAPEPAGFGRRVIAIVIDWLASLLVARLIFPQFEYPGNESALATLGIFYLEVTGLTWLIGSSFGQRITGVAVISDGPGRLTVWRVALRTALICLVIPAVIYDSRGRGLHDKAAGTIAVRRDSVVGR